MLARSLSGAVTIALAAPCIAAPQDKAPPTTLVVIDHAADRAPRRDQNLPPLELIARPQQDTPRDRFDVRALRLEPQRRERSPVAGLRLSIRDDMNASLGTTGALRTFIYRPIIK